MSHITPAPGNHTVTRKIENVNGLPSDKIRFCHENSLWSI